MDHSKPQREMREFIILMSFLAFSSPSTAAVPEYEHFTQEERAEINSPRLIGSEYESDRLTYQFLSPWTASWLSPNNTFQYTAGSLGPTRFLTQGRLRLRHSISEKFDFQLIYVNRGDLRQHRQSLIFEFYFKATSWLQLSVYGEPSTLKKQDDVGLATTFLTSKNSNLRLYYTWVDFSHNKRNEQTDRYQKQPGSIGAVWRWLDKGSFIQGSFRKDLMTKQVFLNGRIYQYASTQAQWQSRHKITAGDSQYLQTEFNYSRSHEADNRNLDQKVQRWENQTFDGLIQIQRPFSWFRLYGIRALYSEWNSNQGTVVHNDLLPHVWFTPFSFNYGTNPHSIDVGYEFVWHRGQGPEALRSTLDRMSQVEHRMNWRYRMISQGPTQFNLLLTFDLDEFGGGETWEGGAMQFSTQF